MKFDTGLIKPQELLLKSAGQTLETPALFFFCNVLLLRLNVNSFCIVFLQAGGNVQRIQDELMKKLCQSINIGHDDRSEKLCISESKIFLKTHLRMDQLS